MHSEALTKEGKAILPLLAAFAGFYLVGGTGLSLHIGHRISVDFDMFTEKPLQKELFSKAKGVFKPFSVVLTYRSPEQINLIVSGVKITFFHFSYPVIDPLTSYLGVNIASIKEIAAMKAFSIGKRLAYKDYVDWYFLLSEQHTSLANVIAHAKKKFGADFNDRLFLGHLASFSDVPTQTIDFLRNEVQRTAIKRYLAGAIKSFRWQS